MGKRKRETEKEYYRLKYKRIGCYDSQPDVSLGTDSAIKRRVNTTRDRNTQRFQLKSETQRR